MLLYCLKCRKITEAKKAKFVMKKKMVEKWFHQDVKFECMPNNVRIEKIS